MILDCDNKPTFYSFFLFFIFFYYYVSFNTGRAMIDLFLFNFYFYFIEIIEKIISSFSTNHEHVGIFVIKNSMVCHSSNHIFFFFFRQRYRYIVSRFFFLHFFDFFFHVLLFITCHHVACVIVWNISQWKKRFMLVLSKSPTNIYERFFFFFYDLYNGLYCKTSCRKTIRRSICS